MNAHEAAARAAYHRAISTPDGADAVADIQREMTNGHIAGEYLDVIGQSGFGALSPEQVLDMAVVHAGICEGRFAVTKVRAAGRPQSDRQRDANAEAVANLPGPFTATVDLDQQAGDCDGRLAWHEPVIAEVTFGTEICDDGRVREICERIYVAPFQLPLEIGTTLPSRTLLHLNFDGGVARWPYGQDCITVLFNLGYPLVRWRTEGSGQVALF